jgi:hypothetical protein
VAQDPEAIPGARTFHSESGGFIISPSDLLNGEKPEANWIWDSGEPNPRNYFLHARKSFELEGDPKTAKAYISAFSFAELYINGQYIDRVPTNPDPEYQTYEEIDLASYLHAGTNTIAALIYNAGEGLHHRMDGRGGFFFQATITDEAGNAMKVLSDKSWRVAQAEAWDCDTGYRQADHTIGMNERYDSRLSHEGWQLSSFDDSGWEQATETGVPPVAPWNKIIVIKRERLLYEDHEPVVSWKAQGYTVFDFGKEISAFPRVCLTADDGGISMLLGTGERLDENRLPTMKYNVDFTDTYITKKGEQCWQPLTWRGFRYLAIEDKAGISLDNVSAQFRSFPVERSGRFACSDPLLNEIWEIGRWTLQICAHDTWMDTPWREQTQYIAGDTRYNLRYSAYAFDLNIKLLHDYNILCGALSQRHSSEGAIRSRYPTGYHLGPTTSTYIPDYELEWILMLREHYLYFRDAELVKQVYPNMAALLEYFRGYLSAERGLLQKVPGWVVLDHPDTYPMDVDGENTAMNCLYHGALNAAAWMARNVVNEPSQAAEWERQAQTLKDAIRAWLWSEEDKAYKDGYDSSRITQQTQVYALKYGLAPAEHRHRMVAFVKSQGRSCEQSFSYWLLHVMFAEGEGQWALDYVRTHWGAQMKQADFNGAWHEQWVPGGSTSHAWCSGPTALLPEFVLGVTPLSPGWDQFEIKPNLYDLKWAEGVIPSAAGAISSKVGRLMAGDEDNGIRMEVVVPANTSAKVHVPRYDSDDFAVYVNSEKLWTDGQSVGDNMAASIDTVSSEAIIVDVPSGSYVIQGLGDGTHVD